MSSQKTDNLQLHTWEATDSVKRTEFNENFAKIDAEVTAAKNANTGVDTKVGDLATLSTTDKTDVVSAVNEVKSKADTVESSVSSVDARVTEIERPTTTATWTATEGQLVYTLGSGTITAVQALYVGGIPQFEGVNFTVDSPTQITLIADASEVAAGTEIIAVYK